MISDISSFSYLDNPNLNLIRFINDGVHVTYSRIKKVQDLAVWFFSKVISLITFGVVSLKYDEPRIVMLRQHLTHLQNTPLSKDQNCIALFEELDELAKKIFISTETKDQIVTLQNTLIQSYIRQIEESDLDYPSKSTALAELSQNSRIKPETKDQIVTLQNTLAQSYIRQIEESDLDYPSKSTALINFVSNLKKNLTRLDEATYSLLIKATCKIYINSLTSNERRRWIDISKGFRELITRNIYYAIRQYSDSFFQKGLETIASENLEEEVNKLDERNQQRIKSHLTANPLFSV